MKEDTDNQLIEDYIDGNLKGAELANFQKRLKSDAEFAKAYNLRLKLANLWQQADQYQQTKAQIREVMDAEKKSRFFNHRKAYYLLAIAASIILLLGVYWLIDSRDKNLKNEMAETAGTIVFQMDKPDKLAEIQYTVQLISPENEQSFKQGDTIEFRWKPSVDTVKVKLLIQKRNNNENVFQLSNFTADYFLFSTSSLDPGEYVWSVQDSTNSRFFTIK
jgi:hypothetical protein